MVYCSDIASVNRQGFQEKKNDRSTDFKGGLIRVPYSCGPTCSSLRVFLKENSKIGCWIVMQSTGLVISSDLQYVLES